MKWDTKRLHSATIQFKIQNRATIYLQKLTLTDYIKYIAKDNGEKQTNNNDF